MSEWFQQGSTWFGLAWAIFSTMVIRHSDYWPGHPARLVGYLGAFYLPPTLLLLRGGRRARLA